MTTASVSLRGSELTAEAIVHERDGGAIFISIERPPPVRAALELRVGDGDAAERKAARVRSVDEGGRGPDGTGCLADWIELDELDRALAEVGSEGLGAGADAPAAIDDDAASRAEAEGDAAQQGDADASGDEEADDDGSSADGEQGDPDGDADASPPAKGKRTKKRKGRKRG